MRVSVVAQPAKINALAASPSASVLGNNFMGKIIQPHNYQSNRALLDSTLHKP
jgi:hypothetical protein